MFIVDAHLDLSMNALDWNRDLTQPLSSIRNREKGLLDKPDRGQNVVTFEELRKGNIGLVVATQIARYVSESNPLPGWHSPEQAWAHTQAQRSWYQCMEDLGHLRLIDTKSKLQKHLDTWNQNTSPIGYILSLEGADSLVNLTYLDKAYAYGLRAIGPAHYGPGRYSDGTDANSHLHPEGKELLKSMIDKKMILDVTHLCDLSFWDAMEIWTGPVWASHQNSRKIVNHNRQHTDEQMKEVIRRGGVIGAAFDAWMLVPDWKRGISNPIDLKCNLEKVIDQIVYVCTLAGNTNHSGIGSDLDGGYGREQSPYDVQSICDLQLLIEKLMKRGFTNADIEKIMHRNWINLFLHSLPD